MNNPILMCFKKCFDKSSHLCMPNINTEAAHALKDIRRELRNNCAELCLKTEMEDEL